MSNQSMESQIKELLELKRMREELDNEIQTAEDAIKQVMGEEETLLTDGVVVAIGLAPENEAFSDIVTLDRGCITAENDMSTRAEGIFTTGDCRVKAVRQIATAVSDGAVAALSACEYIDRK